PPATHNAAGVGVINVGRGGPNVIVRNIEDRPERQPRDRGQVLEAGPVIEGGLTRPARGVITNENLPSVIGTTTVTNSNGGTRPGRTERDAAPTAAGPAS